MTDKINNSQRLNKHLLVNSEVHNMITVECVDEYLKNHPEMKGAKISQNHILRQIAQYYIKH